VISLGRGARPLGPSVCGADHVPPRLYGSGPFKSYVRRLDFPPWCQYRPKQIIESGVREMEPGEPPCAGRRSATPDRMAVGGNRGAGLRYAAWESRTNPARPCHGRPPEARPGGNASACCCVVVEHWQACTWRCRSWGPARCRSPPGSGATILRALPGRTPPSGCSWWTPPPPTQAASAVRRPGPVAVHHRRRAGGPVRESEGDHPFPVGARRGHDQRDASTPSGTTGRPKGVPAQPPGRTHRRRGPMPCRPSSGWARFSLGA